MPMYSCSKQLDFSIISAKESRHAKLSLFLLRLSLLTCLLYLTFLKMESAAVIFSKLLARFISCSLYSDSMIISSNRLSTCVILLLDRSKMSTSALIARTISDSPRSVILLAPSKHFSMAFAFFNPAARAIIYLSPKL